MTPSPWPRLIALLLVAGLIAGVECKAIEAGLDGVALAASVGALGAIAGFIARSIFPLRSRKATP